MSIVFDFFLSWQIGEKSASLSSAVRWTTIWTETSRTAEAALFWSHQVDAQEMQYSWIRRRDRESCISTCATGLQNLSAASEQVASDCRACICSFSSNSCWTCSAVQRHGRKRLTTVSKQASCRVYIWALCIVTIRSQTVLTWPK